MVVIGEVSSSSAVPLFFSSLNNRIDSAGSEKISPIIEFNGYHTIDASNAALVGFTGVDVANLGGGEQQDTITMGLGAAFRIHADWAIRAAYDLPLTNDLDLFGDRVTLSAVYSF